jgi:hypothetical protein
MSYFKNKRQKGKTCLSEGWYQWQRGSKRERVKDSMMEILYTDI